MAVQAGLGEQSSPFQGCLSGSQDSTCCLKGRSFFQQNRDRWKHSSCLWSGDSGNCRVLPSLLWVPTSAPDLFRSTQGTAELSREAQSLLIVGESWKPACSGEGGTDFHRILVFEGHFTSQHQLGVKWRISHTSFHNKRIYRMNMLL
jgi:hypothetical protein